MLTLGGVSSPWQVLHRAGLPLAGGRSGPVPSLVALAQAAREVLADPPGAGRERDAFCAFLLAWQQQWPSAFAVAFGGDADPIAAWAATRSSDLDRYLKLRRIAIENLTEVL